MRESETSSVFHVIKAVPSAFGNCVSAEMTGGVVVLEVDRFIRSGRGREYRISNPFDRFRRVVERRSVVRDAAERADRRLGWHHRLQPVRTASRIDEKRSEFAGLLHATPLNDEPLRPSSQVSICRAETTGTPRACAEAMMASEPA